MMITTNTNFIVIWFGPLFIFFFSLIFQLILTRNIFFLPFLIFFPSFLLRKKMCLLVFYCGNYYSRVRVLSVSEYDTFDENKVNYS